MLKDHLILAGTYEKKHFKVVTSPLWCYQVTWLYR